MTKPNSYPTAPRALFAAVVMVLAVPVAALANASSASAAPDCMAEQTTADQAHSDLSAAQATKAAAYRAYKPHAKAISAAKAADVAAASAYKQSKVDFGTANATYKSDPSAENKQSRTRALQAQRQAKADKLSTAASLSQARTDAQPSSSAYDQARSSLAIAQDSAARADADLETCRNSLPINHMQVGEFNFSNIGEVVGTITVTDLIPGHEYGLNPMSYCIAAFGNEDFHCAAETAADEGGVLQMTLPLRKCTDTSDTVRIRLYDTNTQTVVYDEQHVVPLCETTPS